MTVEGLEQNRDERLGGAHATAFIAGAIILSRGARQSPEFFDFAVRVIDAAYVENPVLAVPTLAVDLSRLMAGERLGADFALDHERLRDAHRRYEDHVLARLLGDRRWSRVAEAMGAAPRQLRAAAIGLMTARLHQRFGVQKGVMLSSAIIRRMRGRLVNDMVELGQSAVVDPLTANRLADGLEWLARGARSAREVLSDADIFLLENIAELKHLSSRIALEQLATVSQIIEENLPRRMRGRSPNPGDARTALDSESAHPVGGFSAVTTQGVFENLLPSELGYLDRAKSNRPDLFDLRFVENELLYFWRDESVDIRRRKTIVFAIDQSLTHARAVDRNGSFQRIVWGLGTIAATVRKLTAWMDREALRFEIVFAEQDRRSAINDGLADEMNALSLLLRDFQIRGQVLISRAADLGEVLRRSHERPRERARSILMTTNFLGRLERNRPPDVVVDCATPIPTIHWANPQLSAKHGALIDDSSSLWTTTARQLLEGLLNDW